MKAALGEAGVTRQWNVHCGQPDLVWIKVVDKRGLHKAKAELVLKSGLTQFRFYGIDIDLARPPCHCPMAVFIVIFSICLEDFLCMFP